MMRLSLLFCSMILGQWITSGHNLAADEIDSLPVGRLPDGRIVVPTNQILKPAGRQVTFPGRPVDLCFTEGGRVVVVKNMTSLEFLDAASGELRQTLTLPKGQRNLGFSVVGLVARDKIYASDTRDHVRVAVRKENGKYDWGESLAMKTPAVGDVAHPAGMAFYGDKELWVTSTRGNNVHRFDLATGKILQVIPVGVAPYTLCFASGRCFVSNWGGNPPRPGDETAKTSGTSIRVDPRTRVANQGTISVLEKPGDTWVQGSTIEVGLHPCALLASPGGKRVYVANANSDTVSVIDVETTKVVETIPCRPEGRLPFGSGSNALALNSTGDVLYVANGTNNCLAVVRLSSAASESGPATAGDKSEVVGLIPTGWYPGSILLSPDQKQLFVGNIKGYGSLHQPRPVKEGRKSRDHLGSVSLIEVPDSSALAHHTQTVNANNRLGYSLAGLNPPRAAAVPFPVPHRHGEPSVFKHVLYIIKENRTYDQVFGDMKEGNGDPSLVLFGEQVTPNHHALARTFTLFDNFYCSGVLSADGHSWTNEAYVTDYLERAFGGFTRSYPDNGEDALAYPATGFLWDNALAKGKSLRIFGEFVDDNYAPKGTTWTKLYREYLSGKLTTKLTVRSNMKSLERYTHPGYPWFPLFAPDVYRAKLFLDELKEYERKGTMPNLMILTLPCDHTDGTTAGFPTPRAMVADNDLALGQIVEAISKSRFWRDTCIFVVEDDPQDGFDHVDAHRTVALAISPYTRRGFVDHTHYNQTGMVKTIELILGLPPMNQLDLSATPMRHCFQNLPDLTPYKCRPNNIPLDEMNPDMKTLKGKALYWARKSAALNLHEGDKADEDTLNRILWHSVRGYDTPYPEQYARSRDGEED